jgi:hypothetical protein
VAAYIIPLGLWYILPAPVTARLEGYISLSPHRQGHKYKSYLEAWHVVSRDQAVFRNGGNSNPAEVIGRTWCWDSTQLLLPILAGGHLNDYLW